jgi:hypothetical protein
MFYRDFRPEMEGGRMDAERVAAFRREPVRVEGCLRECRPVRETVDGRVVEGLTATVQGSRARYGEAYHVTFPATRDLDLWVTAVAQAWAEARAQRTELIGELPDWMRPRGSQAGELRVIVWGQLRCGKPIPPSGVRPATVLAERTQFPGLGAEVVCRAEALWRAARAARARKEIGNG